MKSRRLVIATRNPHKLEEIRAVLGDLDVEVRSAMDYPECPEVVEDGATLEANAEKKARVVCQHTRELTLADDSGLEVDALDGAPGVISARYAGEGCSYADNNAKLLRKMQNVPDAKRNARFRSVVALCSPTEDGPGAVALFEGRIEGRIARAPRGDGGFGYDPIFYVWELDCTLAQLDAEQKNRVSHRARALEAARGALEVLLAP